MRIFHTHHTNPASNQRMQQGRKAFLLLALSLTVPIIAWSCKQFIDIDPPKKKLVEETVFKTNETATAAVLNIYSSMANSFGPASPYFMAVYTGLSADELRNFCNTVTIEQIYVNSITALGAATNNIWNTAYLNIYKANAIIEGCTTSTTINAEVKQQLIGEAMFIRAFWHLYLVNSYGDVPLVLTTDYTVNSRLARSDKGLVYQQIVNDLITAQSSLQENYVGLNGTTLSTERVRPNKSAATALLARTYLYTENFTGAEEQAGKVIDLKSNYALVSIDSAFLKNNKEAIWQLMVTTPNTSNTSEGLNFILNAKPSTTQIANSSTISKQLFDAFELNDKRKTTWIGKYTDATVTPNVIYNYPNKYKVKTGTAITEYSTVLRLAEQYFIRAEARAKQGNLLKAIEDLDAIRKRAGLPLIKDTNPGMGKEDLLVAILKERRVELFTEWGHRWYDLKRTGQINTIMTNTAVEKGSTWDTRKQLWPIPPPDIQNNNKLIQNPSYN